ncbi:hypothetical protein EDB80DRAFT_881920 [Ilyonectria destructans]|nr:hypothetical protein EDB80DRAFT_881920 [Ilyonectria destructans]
MVCLSSLVVSATLVATTLASDQDQRAFFWIANTNWELFHKLNRTDVDLYLADRAGFTFLHPWDSRKNYFTCATNLDVHATD